MDALPGIVQDEMKNRTVTEKIKKIIAVLHISEEGKLIWNLQCILDGLAILNVHVDDSDQSVLKFEKHSLLEMIKPMAAMMQEQGKQQGQESPEAPAAPVGGMQMNKENLQKLQEEIMNAVKKARAEQNKTQPAKMKKLVKSKKSKK